VKKVEGGETKREEWRRGRVRRISIPHPPPTLTNDIA